MKFFPFNTRIAMLNEAGLPNTFINQQPFNFHCNPVLFP